MQRSSMSSSKLSHSKASSTKTPKESKARNKPRVSDSQSSASPLSSTACRELCGYTHRVCLQNRLEGFNYCIRHILIEKNAPFKQCTYIHPVSNKKCPNAARKTERKHSDTILCPWHIKKVCLKRKLNHGDRHHHRPRDAEKSLPQLMKDLEHYCAQDHDKNRRNVDWIKQEDDTSTATEELRAKIADAAAALANESDSDDGMNNPLVEETLNPDVIDSDSESIDSDQEDPLKHAGVYTAEEVSLILSEKMHRLQSLYIEQFKFLKYLLKDKYRKFNIASNQELESLQQMVESASPEDQIKYRALRRYHKYRGKEALLKKQAKEKRRALTEGPNYVAPVFPSCIYITGDQPCNARSLPTSNYCSKHILYDVNQMLFRPCASGLPPCLNPVISFQHKNSCIAHRDLKTDDVQAKKIAGRDEELTSMGNSNAEPELFQTMDDIAALALDAVAPTSLFGLDQFGDLGSSDLLQ